MRIVRLSSLLVCAPLLLLAPLLATCASVARTAPATPGVPGMLESVEVAPLPAPAQIYSRMNERIAAAGGLHARIVTETLEADQDYVTTQHVWLDGLGRARLDVETTFLLDPPVTRSAISIVDGAATTILRQEAPVQTQEALVCRGAPDAALALLLGCRGFLESSQVRVGAPHEMTGAIPIVSRGVAPGTALTTTFEDTLYVDPVTMLPVVLDAIAVVDDGAQHRLHTLTTYHFDAYDSMWETVLFDVAELGGTPPLPVAALGDLAPGVHWPRRIDAGEGPPLLLASTFVSRDDNAAWLPYRAELAYRRADDPFAPPEITLRLFAAGTELPDGAVFIDAPAGRVLIHGESPEIDEARLHAVASILGSLVHALT